MEDQQDIRWKQRLDTFINVSRLLERTVAIENPNEAELMGQIQAFEMSFEVAWKLLQDYLKFQGYEERGPRSVIKTAYRDGIIRHGELWLEALVCRNESNHVYDEIAAQKTAVDIQTKFVPLLLELKEDFKERLLHE